MPLCVDDQWMRIDDEMNTDGDYTKPIMGCMVRPQGGGMVVGRIVRKDASLPATGLIAQRWRLGKFIAIGEYSSMSIALKALEDDRA